MIKKYNKLVRDEIPNIIIKNNGKPYIRTLEDKEYKRELEKKLLEEYNEVLEAKDSNSRIEELADMIEIISSLAKLENSTFDEVIKVAKIKKEKRGGFDKKIFLEKVIED